MDRLEIRNLSIRSAKNLLVDDVNFEVKTDKITAIVGKSGSGKTLTSMAIQGFVPSNLRSSGSVFLNGSKIDANLARGRVFATIMQNPRTAFNQLMSIRAHAVETLKSSRNFSSSSDKFIVSTFKDVGLDESVLKLYPFEMSGGMLQRAMIALALISKSKFIIADEPTTDLDLVVQMKILDLLKSLVAKNHLGLLLVTHDFGVVAKMADEVLVMKEGRIVEKGGVKEIFASPKHEATKELIRSHLSFYGDLNELG
ncbi:ATP-binding cassette domain-containing protein [Campylobacter sp.]|uniref:ATP-binding cassette domain-containing protein n=1 Tax=Campylobacter sp. TaxID=205 RepID=UPI0026F9CC71|nr:ATP-binding cassette domain-containing protein [Campylobacter sp.]